MNVELVQSRLNRRLVASMLRRLAEIDGRYSRAAVLHQAEAIETLRNYGVACKACGAGPTDNCTPGCDA